MTKAQNKALVRLACSKYVKKYPALKHQPDCLVGRRHIERSLITENLAKVIPNNLSNYLYFRGQGQLDIISDELAQMIAEELGIPADFFSTQIN